MESLRPWPITALSESHLRADTDINCGCAVPESHFSEETEFSVWKYNSRSDPRMQGAIPEQLNNSWTFGIFYIQEDLHYSVYSSNVVIFYILWLNSPGRTLHARVLLWEKCDLNPYSEPAPDRYRRRTSVTTYILPSASVVSLVMTLPVTFHQCSFTGILKKETKPI